MSDVALSISDVVKPRPYGRVFYSRHLFDTFKHTEKEFISIVSYARFIGNKELAGCWDTLDIAARGLRGQKGSAIFGESP